MLTYGIDVSSQQAEEVPGVVPGIDFVFVKATEGHTYTSPVQKAQAAAARKAGRVVGFYHFLWPRNLEMQAEYFVKQCASIPGDLLAVDWETTSDSSWATCHEKDRFLALVKELRPHHRVLLYCNRDFWFQHDTTSQCGDGLWIADPGAPAGRPRIKHGWAFHQYSDTAGKLDRNAYNGSPAGLRSWATGLL